PHGATNVALNVDLSWGPLDGELLLNGNFETGDLSGWMSDDIGSGGWVLNNGAFDPESPDGPLPPFAGSFSVLAEQVGNGTHILWQDVLIPDSTASATLTWRDRIRNHAGTFTAHQQFRVELR